MFVPRYSFRCLLILRTSARSSPPSITRQALTPSLTRSSGGARRSKRCGSLSNGWQRYAAMTKKRKVLTIAAVVLFAAGPVLFYEYSDLLDASHDRVRCGAWYADYLKYTKYSNTRNYMTET